MSSSGQGVAKQASAEQGSDDERRFHQPHSQYTRVATNWRQTNVAAIDADRKGGYNLGMAFLLSARPPFNLPVVVNSHGWVQLAPFSHDQESDGFDYLMELSSGQVIRRGEDLCYERSWSLC